jgi:hypothetical protein
MAYRRIAVLDPVPDGDWRITSEDGKLTFEGVRIETLFVYDVEEGTDGRAAHNV